jgi:hypothetical protein
VKARLAVLRNHSWSSYQAYAGYAPKPDWLTCERLWWHAGQEKGVDPKADYRRYLEDYLRQGVEEGVFARLTLRELGKEAGGMTVPCVAKACERMVKRGNPLAAADRNVCATLNKKNVRRRSTAR